jgi:MoaA/NifB/PqqE/SkfB family radical SAM enzyme
MRVSTRNYWLNRLKLMRGDHLLHPLVVTYYVTTHCNLNCAYCEDFGTQRNQQAEDPLPLDDALRVLQIVREATDSLILTGGEPLLCPDIVALATRAKRQLGFRHITLLTNGLLLPQRETILSALDRLVVSLDTTDAHLVGQITGAPLATADMILKNVRTYARRQTDEGYQLIVNCVLTPETLAGAQSVLDFCLEHQLLVSFSPQAVHNWPHYDLLVSDAYKAFLTQVIQLKRQGAPILGSAAYLHTMRNLIPFTCYPTLVPRVMPNGDLVYPCRPIEREQGTHGGRPCNLLEVASWKDALDIALAVFGLPPRICTSCFQQCFAEPSLMQTHSLGLANELARYPASRRGVVWTHAPG